jgi:Carbohydrate esterase, sialic acid-specific acetylesterase
MNLPLEALLIVMNAFTLARRTWLSVCALVLITAGCGGSDDSETAAASRTPAPSPPPSASSAMPVYLLAGPSNMEGHGDEALFGNLLADLSNSNAAWLTARLVERLRSWCFDTNDGYASYGYLTAMAKYQATHLIRLRGHGWVVDQVRQPHSTVSSPASVHPHCATKECEWAAFVFFQGENDSFDAASASAYKKSLRLLIADVRKGVGNPNLPLVVVQIGNWAQSLPYGQSVAVAQQAAVNSDAGAQLAQTSDLSGFYHHGPASKLTIG